jgi:glycosyltransferase involved in cell wall biosynthesis
MRICFVSHSAGRGGAEKALLELLVALKERGVECFCVLPRRGPMSESLEAMDVTSAIVPYGWWAGRDRSLLQRARRALRTLVHLPAVVSLIREWKCDLVYTNTIAICAGALAARLAGRGHVWHIHEFGREDHQLNFDLGERLSLRAIDRLSSACIVNSHAVAAKYGRSIGQAKLHVVDYAVDVAAVGRAAADRENGALRCVIVGTLTPSKRQEDAILAIRDLAAAGVPAELQIVGDGKREYAEHLRRLVADHGLGSRVRFLGHLEDPMPVVAAADVLLMCSLNEAFGRVTVEAMKAGKAVVGTRSGGTPELIREGETGLLYAPGNSSELADRIRHLHANPGLARSMGQRGKLLAARRFTRELYGGAILNILTRVLAERAR